jgi:hypothetical protein
VNRTRIPGLSAVPTELSQVLREGRMEILSRDSLAINGDWTDNHTMNNVLTAVAL